jgi:hypothetical protein
MMTNCTHTKTKSCTSCGVCIRCSNDECVANLAQHPIADKTNEKEIRAKRSGKSENDQAAKRQCYVSGIGSLSEKTLFAKVDAVIEEAVAEFEESSSYRVSKLANSNGIELPKRLMERLGGYNLEQLDAKQNAEDICIIGSRLIDAAFNSICDNPVAAEKAKRMLVSSFLAKGSETKRLIQDTLADIFIRSSDRVDSRMIFAAFGDIDEKDLTQFLNSAKDRALNDNSFMGNVKARSYVRKDPDTETSEKIELSVSRQLDLKVSWAKSAVRKSQAQEDLRTLLQGVHLPTKYSKPRVGENSLVAALWFLYRNSLGWKGGATKGVVEISPNCIIQDVPYLNMALSQSEAWDKYSELSQQNNGVIDGWSTIGRTTFFKLYDATSKLIEEKHSLSYFYTQCLEAFSFLGKVIARLRELYALHKQSDSSFEEFQNLGYNFETLSRVKEQCISHMKYGLRCHIKVEACKDGNMLHCGCFGVGHPCGNNVSHVIGDCYECKDFLFYAAYVRELRKAIANGISRDHPEPRNRPIDDALLEIQSMREPIDYVAKTINLYYRHVCRAVWQSNAVNEIVKNLKPGQVLVTFDHKQKIQPINYNESSEEYYGKKGMSLLGFFIRFRVSSNGPIHTRFIDVISLNSKQNAKQVQGIVKVVVPVIKEIVPQANDMILLSDNGPAFTSKDNMKVFWNFNQDQWGCNLTLSKWVYFESQCGKTALDTHFSFVGIRLNRYARLNGAVKVHSDIFKALVHDGGIQNTATMLVKFNGAHDDDAEEVEDDKDTDSNVQEVRKIHEIIFTEKGVTTFRFSGVNLGSASYDWKETKETHNVEVVSKRLAGTISTPAEKPTANNAQPAGPSLGECRNAAPFDRLIATTILGFAVEEREVVVLDLEKTSIVTQSVFSVVQETVPTKAKKAKLQVSDNGDLSSAFHFHPAWAVSTMRQMPELPGVLVEVLRELVSHTPYSKVNCVESNNPQFLQGEQTGSKCSASQAVERLLQTDQGKTNWFAIFTCNEGNCKKSFTKFTKERKELQKKAAAEQLSKHKSTIASAAGSTTTTPKELITADDLALLAPEEEALIENIDSTEEEDPVDTMQ